jgi:dienelactone hydrolase
MHWKRWYDCISYAFHSFFEDEKEKQEKGIGAFRANAYSQQPAVRAAARVCGFLKLTLFSRLPELFDAKFEKSSRRAP